MSPRAPIRWWPAAAILAVTGGLLGWIWLREAPSAQSRVVPSFPVLFFGVLALFVWLVLFSRLPAGVRRRVFLAVAGVVALGFALLEIRGVDGNLVPIVGWRWRPERSFGVEASGAAAAVAAAGDYPQFYGPRRDATLPGPRLAADWEAEPPREIWRREVGEGWSSFAVAGSAAVTQEQRSGRETVVRYDLATGRQEWVHEDPTSFDTTVGGSGPRATPTIAAGRVYTLGATGTLNCLDLETGRRIWSRQVLEDHGARLSDWGLASSPLVVGDLVIVQLSERGVGLAAYRRETGEPVWRAGEDEGSYNSPVLLTLAGRPQVVTVYQRSLAGHDPVTGEVLWQESWPDPGERVSPPVRIAEDLLLVSAGYGVGSRLLRIAEDGGRFTVDEVWESRRLKSKFAPLVLHEGVVYGLDDGVLAALDPADGERLWKGGRYGHGQIVLVGDKLVIQAENGDVVLVAADPSAHRELARLRALSGKTWNPPAIAGRLLLVRNNREAICYELPVERG